MADDLETLEAAGFTLHTADPVMKAVMRKLAEVDDECRRLNNQLNAAPQDFSQPPDPALAGKVPLVLYFSTREDAQAVGELIKQAMVNPVEIRLP